MWELLSKRTLTSFLFNLLFLFFVFNQAFTSRPTTKHSICSIKPLKNDINTLYRFFHFLYYETFENWMLEKIWGYKVLMSVFNGLTLQIECCTSNTIDHLFIHSKLIWLLKFQIDQNLVVIYLKFNRYFKRHISFEMIKRE
jgi:hypothetical protein